jgi:HK97 family phage major capsid protein
LTANFVSEGATIPESQLQFDALTYSLKKLAILARCSSELFEDSAPDLAEFVATEVAYAFAATEDDCGFNGTGTLAYNGISGLGTALTGKKSAITATSGHNTYLLLDNTDIATLMAGVMAAALPTARWYVSNVAYAQTFCRLAGVSGGLVSQILSDGTIRASYLGHPVEFSSKLPNSTSSLSGSAMIYFGDLRLSSAIVEHRSGTVIAASADRAMDADQVLVRGTRRLDILNHDVGDAATYGPVAALIGN